MSFSQAASGMLCSSASVYGIFMFANSDLVGTLPTRVASTFADMLGLERMQPPLPMPKFQLAATWHERTHEDPPHRWLREQVLAVAADLRDVKSS